MGYHSTPIAKYTPAFVPTEVVPQLEGQRAGEAVVVADVICMLD